MGSRKIGDAQYALSQPAIHPAREIQVTAISDAEAEVLVDGILLVACVYHPAVPRVWENRGEIMDLHRNFRMGKVE
jgi:hypothetical protein